MPNINLYEAYKRKVRKFGVNDSTTFQNSFVDAVNLVYSEYNEKVFESALLEPIDSFDDIIDDRLAKFTSLTFDSDCNSAIQNRDYWAVEYTIDRTSDSIGFEDKIVYNASPEIVIALDNTVLNSTPYITITTPGVTATYNLTNSDTWKIKFESYDDGNRLYVNNELVELVYSAGDEEDNIPIGTVTSHVISDVSGLELVNTRFTTPTTVVYDFDMVEEDTATNLTDNVNGYTATLVGQQWDERYVEPSTSLDFRYRSSFEMGLDYHLQDGGQWALEPEPERERKWYTRGIQSARSTYRQLTTYTSPLNP